jgi:imidazoleglycerol-phosphate dehydratase
MLEPRQATIHRRTAETTIDIELVVDGTGKSRIDTGVPFFDHMLTLFAKHGLFDLTVKTVGDIEVDFHHTVEDTGIVLRFGRPWGTRRGSLVMGGVCCRWMRRWRGWRWI